MSHSHRHERSPALSEPARLEIAIEYLLIALLLFMPLALGSVEAWSQLVVILVVASMLGCLAVKLMLQRGSGFVYSWTYLPVLLFLLLIVLQLLPLPVEVVRFLSPNTARTKTELLAELPGNPSASRWMTLSFYPLAARQGFRVILAASAVFVIVLNVFRRSSQIKRLLITVAVVGSAVAALALIQDLTGAPGIYWLIPSPKRASGGPFVNANNFSQFMNASMGATIGLILVYLAEAKRRLARSGGSSDSTGTMLESAAEPLVLLVPIIILGAAAVFLSGSRGGMVSMAIAFALTTLFLASRREHGTGAWALVALGVCILAAALYFDADLAAGRLATLTDPKTASGARWQDNKDAWAMWPRFAAVGVGLGNHEFVFPAFSRLSMYGLSEQLENDYLQLLEETGLTGTILAGAFLVAIGACLLRCMRRVETPVVSAAFGLAFALIAVLIQSAVDFGQHLPANACLTAVFCGLIVNLSRSDVLISRHSTHLNASAPANSGQTVTTPRISWIPVAALLIAIGGCGWVGVGAARASVAQAHWKDAMALAPVLARQNWQADNEQFAKLISHAAAASAIEPENIRYRYDLNLFRWYSITRIRDPKTGEILLTDTMRGFAERIADELDASRLHCPTYGPLWCLTGQLRLSVLGQARGESMIATGYALAPTNPTACFVAGELDTQRGRWDESLIKFRGALAAGYSLREILDVYVRVVDRPDLALRIVGGDTEGQSTVAALLEQSGRHPDIVAATRTRLADLEREQGRQARDRAAEPDAPAELVARVAAELVREKDFVTAAKYFRRALGSEYGNIEWRFSLAQALADSGEYEQAKHEATVCLHLRPRFPRAEKLIADLSQKADASRLPANDLP